MALNASRALARAAPMLVAALAAALAVRPIDDFDVWYHLAAGRLMWERGAWPATNTFAFTAPDHPWIDLHWLFQALLYALDRAVGVNGCIVLAAVAAMTVALLLYTHARRFIAPAPAAALVGVALVVASPRLQPRPEMLSFILFALYLRLLDDYPRNGRALVWLVPLQMLWVNTEGIFAIGLGLIGCYWLGAASAFLPLPHNVNATSRCDGRAFARLTAVGVVAALACVVNPYGLTGARFPLELVSRVTGRSIFSHRIGEFQGPFSGYAPALAWTWAALLGVTVVVCLANARRWHLGRLFAVAAFGYLSTQSLRNMALFAWVAVPAVASNLGDILAARRGSSPSANGARAVRVAVVAAFVVLLVAIVTNRFWPAVGIDREFGIGISRRQFSDDAIAFARQVGIGGRPFNCLSMGGYLIWNRYPEDQAFVDGRLEAYPESFFRTYFGVMDDPGAWPPVAAHYDFDYAFLYHGWTSRRVLIRALMTRYGWVLAYYDDTTALLLPGDERHRAVRERAAQAFAALQTRRAEAERRAVSPVGWRPPVEAIEQARMAGEFLTVLGRHGDAVDAYARAVALRPDSSALRVALGAARWRAGDERGAVLDWLEILRRDPDYEPATRALADPSTTVDALAPAG